MSSYRTVFWGILVTAIVSLPCLRAEPPTPGKSIEWKSWDSSVFEQARREHKFVLLDLQAVWCHWCHVMDVQTYADPRIIALMQSHYIAVRVDQDAHPDLANRYQDYGWPATVVFNSDGSEIVKRAGFLPPEQMASMLQAIIDDPSPGPSVTGDKPVVLSATAGRADPFALRSQLTAGYDFKLGGWGTAQKFLNWDNVEYCLVRAQAGDAEAEKMARQTLTAQRQLVDPVWGGVDQYSAEGDWNHPHFEKIMQFQAENMRIYSEAYALWKDPADLKTAQGIYGYVRQFLTGPDGVVYTSQDADLIPGKHAGDYFQLNDAGRRKLGLPRVDRHVYARENGWFIEALTALYQTSGNDPYRDEGMKAAGWVIKNRSIDGGGFRHGEEQDGALSLGDNLAMGRAFLSLYAVTADRMWIDCAERTARFMAGHFANSVHGKTVGFVTASGEAELFASQPDFDENVSLARFANLLFHYTANPADQKMAEDALHFAGAPEIAESRLSSVGGLLLAEQELTTDPLHVAIIGKKDDPVAKSLFHTSMAFPSIYKEVEWIEDPQSNSGNEAIVYPNLPKPAAYICANGICSSPVLTDEKLKKMLERSASLGRR